jgi:hypothetical protein
MLDPSNELPQQEAVKTSSADVQLDATLAALNAVRPPARLEQRIHARLSQERLAPSKFAAPAVSNLREAIGKAWSLPRLAFAASAFVAGVATTVLLMPLLHSPARNTAAPAGLAIQGVAPATPSAPQPAAVMAGTQPSYTVPGPGGRISAMSKTGTVAETRARKQNSDPQLAANKQQRKNAEAKLAKPNRPATQTSPSDAAQSQPAQ